MIKKMISTLCAMIFCLGLLPIAAYAVEGGGPTEDTVTGPATLAAENAPSTLTVGNVTVDTSQGGYWTTDTDGNLVTGSENSYNVHYDTSTNTLYLNGATITASNDSNNNPSNAGIYATTSEGQSVSLNIILQGENNQVSGDVGIYVYSSSTSDASLTISSEDGSNLTASGTVNPGIWVQSNDDEATLTIQNADVEATVTGTAAHGVTV